MTKIPRPPSKISRVLARLLQGPATSRDLEALPTCDHVAHSTAADLRRLGIAIDSEIVEVPGFAGEPTRVAKYSIRPGARAAAEQLLERMRSRRARGRAA